MDRDAIRVKRRPDEAGEIDERRAWACCLVGFVSGVLASAGAVLLWWAVR